MSRKLNFKPNFPTLLIFSLAFFLFLLLNVNLSFAETIYPYWIDENLNVWTKVNLTANGQITLYITKESGYSPNGDDVFIFYDDFSTSTKWSLYQCSITNGIMSCSEDGCDVSAETTKQIPMYDVRIISKIKISSSFTSPSNENPGFDVGFDSTSGSDTDVPVSGNWYLLTFGNYKYSDVGWRIWKHTGTTYSNIYSADNTKESSLDIFHTIEYKIFSSGQIDYYLDDDLLDSYTISTSDLLTDDGGYLAVREFTGEIDYIYVANIVNPEPSVTIYDRGIYYEVVIQEQSGNDLTDYQIKLDGSQLGISSTSESLKISNTPPIENLPPIIEISSPQNETYYTTNLQLKFKVTDDNSTTFWVKAWIEDNLIYENQSYENNTEITLNLQSYITEAKTYYVKVWANDTDSSNPQTSEETVYFTVKDYEIEAINFEEIVYETSDQTYTETIRVNWDLISNISANLYWNSTNKGLANYNSNSTHIILSKTITIPLIQQNNTQVSFYFKNSITYTNGTSIEVDSDSNNQNITYAYWISDITSDKQNYIEFEDATIKVYVKDKVGRADLTANITFIYNSTYSLTYELITYQTLEDTKIFNHTFDTLEAFSNQETRTFYANLTVCYGGSCRVMNSQEKQLNVYQIILTNCSASSLSQTEALTLILKDEETDDNLNGTIEFTTKVWKTGEITREYAWKFENVYNQSICIYPSWASYKIDAMVQYYSANYPDRTYYIYTEISNQTSSVSLYLLPENLASTVIVYVVDENGNKVENAIVKIQRYYVGDNSYKTVAQVKTDFEGKGVTFLRVNEIYYRFIIEKDFVVLRETQPTIIVCTQSSCPPYPITLSVSESKPAEYFQYLGKVAYSCQFNEETNVLRCTVDDTSQLMQKAHLLVEKRGALKFEKLCDNYCESSACTLTCNLGNTTNNLYRYRLEAIFPKTTQILEQNILDFTTGIIAWGTTGLLIAFMTTGTLFFVGIYNPVSAMVFAFLGIIIGYLLGWIPVSLGSIIGLGLAIGILIYKMRT